MKRRNEEVSERDGNTSNHMDYSHTGGRSHLSYTPHEESRAEGIADEESVDTAVKLGGNILKGPFEMKKERG